MFTSRDYGPLNVPKLGNIVLDHDSLTYIENIRLPLALSQLNLFLPLSYPGLLLLISVYSMGGNMGQTRDSQGPLQKELCSRP